MTQVVPSSNFLLTKESRKPRSLPRHVASSLHEVPPQANVLGACIVQMTRWCLFDNDVFTRCIVRQYLTGSYQITACKTLHPAPELHYNFTKAGSSSMRRLLWNPSSEHALRITAGDWRSCSNLDLKVPLFVRLDAQVCLLLFRGKDS